MLIAGWLCLQCTTLQAQTPAIDLQNGVEIYNALREYEDALTVSTVTEENIADIKSRMDKGLALLDKVIKEGNAEEIRTARYFKNNFKYEYGFILGMKGQNFKGVEVFSEIEREMTAYSAADFPLQYVYFDKNYSIKWENFASTQAEYFTGYAEMAYNTGKYEDAIRLNRLALAHSNTTPWLKYIAVNKMLDIYGKNNKLLTETEYCDYAVQSIKSYNLLSESDYKAVQENKYPTTERGVGIILDKAVLNMPAAVARTSEAAMAASQALANNKCLQLFELSYVNKQPLDASFHSTAEAYARKTRELYPARSTTVALYALDRMAQAVSATNCSGLDGIIEKYTFWQQTTKAAEYVKKREQCLENEEKARKKAQKAARRANREFNMYVGAYILPLIKSNAKRDYGVALNLAGKKMAWEFSYMQINKNKENVFDLTIRDVDAKQDDLPRWNGFYAHIQPKFYSKKPMYVGTLLGYAQKDFESFTANVTRDADGAVSQETFQPTVTQYIAMVNVGGLGLTKGFGFDMYCGIGATFNQWDTGNTIHTNNYTIDNPILENRKDQYFGLIVRVGFTMGLNFGRGNMR